MQTKSCWVHGKDSGSSAGHYGERLEEGDAEGERAGGTGIMIVLMPPCTVMCMHRGQMWRNIVTHSHLKLSNLHLLLCIATSFHLMS